MQIHVILFKSHVYHMFPTYSHNWRTSWILDIDVCITKDMILCTQVQRCWLKKLELGEFHWLKLLKDSLVIYCLSHFSLITLEIIVNSSCMICFIILCYGAFWYFKLLFLLYNCLLIFSKCILEKSIIVFSF